jgi:hypothetical protein
MARAVTVVTKLTLPTVLNSNYNILETGNAVTDFIQSFTAKMKQFV